MFLGGIGRVHWERMGLTPNVHLGHYETYMNFFCKYNQRLINYNVPTDGLIKKIY